jgi:hypothetical protein
MTALSKFSLQAPTMYADNVTPIPPGAVLSYNVLIDTVNPPIKAYPVPAANVAAAVNGLITVLFTELGFVPLPGTTYYADAVDSNGLTSMPSNLISFTISAEAAAAPSGFTVG